jgi:hypothetical protein
MVEVYGDKVAAIYLPPALSSRDAMHPVHGRCRAGSYQAAMRKR